MFIGQKCSFFYLANNLSPKSEFFCLKFKMMKDCSFFFTKNLSSNRFSGRIECSFDNLPLFSIQNSETNFQSMTQWPKTTYSVINLQDFLLPPMVPAVRIHWKLDKPHSPSTRSSVRGARNFSRRYHNDRKNFNFQFFLNSSSGHLEYTFSWLQWPKKNTMMSKIAAQYTKKKTF